MNYKKNYTLITEFAVTAMKSLLAHIELLHLGSPPLHGKDAAEFDLKPLTYDFFLQAVSH